MSNLFIDPLHSIPSGPRVQLVNFGDYCLLLSIRNGELIVGARLRHYFNRHFQELKIANEAVEIYDLLSVALEDLVMLIIDRHTHIFGHLATDKL